MERGGRGLRRRWVAGLPPRPALGEVRSAVQEREGRFTEVNTGTFVKSDRHDCAWGDANRDRLPDLYWAQGADDEREKANELWMQQPDGSFVNRSAEYGVTDPYGRGRDTTFIEVNQDGYPDLFVGNRYPRSDGIASPNRLFINEAGQSFEARPSTGSTRRSADTARRPPTSIGTGGRTCSSAARRRASASTETTGARLSMT